MNLAIGFHNQLPTMQGYSNRTRIQPKKSVVYIFLALENSFPSQASHKPFG